MGHALHVREAGSQRRFCGMHVVYHNILSGYFLRRTALVFTPLSRQLPRAAKWPLPKKLQTKGRGFLSVYRTPLFSCASDSFRACLCLTPSLSIFCLAFSFGSLKLKWQWVPSVCVPYVTMAPPLGRDPPRVERVTYESAQRVIPSTPYVSRVHNCDRNSTTSSQGGCLSPQPPRPAIYHQRHAGDFRSHLRVASFLCFLFVFSDFFVPTSCSPHASLSTLSLDGYVAAPTEFLSGVRISVNGGATSVAPTSSGRFFLPPLPAGSYLLQPSHPRLIFPSYLVKILPASPVDKARPGGRGDPGKSLTAQVFLLGDSFRPLHPSHPLPAPFRIEPGPGSPAYFTVKPPFNLLFLLQQPILLVGAFCCALMWCLPKLQQYQEEEERQQRLLASQENAAACVRDGRDVGRRGVSPHTSVSAEDLDDQAVAETSAFRKGLMALKGDFRTALR
ncbi:transmembrane protein [Cystoisospora suis]|uniref:Transmembrane protein n=1 Tax=Cystoisospora suis TaxID=483139 RepID=A0A2C6L074_9APIC|nr:transmembrane protein [Cystoisospora suis]